MTEGATVIITQVDVVDLNSNQLYMDILQSRSQLHIATATAKINVCTQYSYHNLHYFCHRERAWGRGYLNILFARNT